MNEPNEAYLKLVRDTMPKSKHLVTCLRAFWVGGLICCIGQAFRDLYAYLLPDASKNDLRSYVTLTLIFITAALTGVGVFDRIGAYAGAGSFIPITGFANAVVSPAIEHRREGVVLGLCDNMFTVAGPVIVFGITASVVIGIIVMLFPGAFAV